jgi:pilus assembly protein CpaE
MGDRCHALATYIGDEVDDQIVAMLESRLNGTATTVIGDKAVHETHYKGNLVWRRSWGELLDTAYMPRIAFSLRQAEAPESPVLTVVMDGVVVFQGVPDWIARSLSGEPPDEADRDAFIARVLDSVRGSLDRPVAYLADEPAAQAAPEPAAKAAPGPALEASEPAPEAAPTSSVATWARVLVVAEDQITLDGLTQLLAEDTGIEVVGTTIDPSSAVEEVHTAGADVVVVDLNLSSNAGLWLTERLSSESSLAQVILVAEDEASASLRRAHLAGARDVLVWPFSAQILIAAIRNAVSPPETVDEGRLRIAEDTSGAEPERQTAIQAPAPVHRQAPAARGEVIAVFSPKGGVGKSLIAANLAGALAVQSGGAVGLFDLDLRFGDLSGLLGLERGTSVARYLAAGNQPSPAELERLAAAGPYGIRLLLGSVTPDEAEKLTPDHVRQVIEALRHTYQHSVIDCSAQAGRQTLAAVVSADRIILVTDVDTATIRNARLALGMLSSISVSPDRVSVVLNRTSPNDPISAADIERMIGRELTLQLPQDDQAVQQSLFQSSLLVGLHPDSPVSRGLRELAAALVTAAA